MSGVKQFMEVHGMTPKQTVFNTSNSPIVKKVEELEARIATLEGALDDLCGTAQIVTLKQGDIYHDIHRYRPGDEVIVIGGFHPGEILGRTSDHPDATAWLREQEKSNNGN